MSDNKKPKKVVKKVVNKPVESVKPGVNPVVIPDVVVKPPETPRVQKENVLRKRKYTLVNRLNMWFCDRLGLVSVHDFDCFFEEVDKFFVFSLKRFGDIDGFAKAQSDFDKRVAVILGLDKQKGDEVKKDLDVKGVYV